MYGHQRQDEFIEEHGEFVMDGGMFVFIDGAQMEDNSLGVGRLYPPSDDDFERLQAIAKYWLIKTQQDENKFVAYKDYLGGTGMREDEWAKLYTEQEQLDHLCLLGRKAKRSRAKYYFTKRAADANTPVEHEDDLQQEVDDQRRKHQFRSAVDSINI